MIFGKLYHKYATPIEFIQQFDKANKVLGGIFVVNVESPEMLVAQNSNTGKLYIFENFSHPRRLKSLLPVCVFEIDDTILAEARFKKVSPRFH